MLMRQASCRALMLYTLPRTRCQHAHYGRAARLGCRVLLSCASAALGRRRVIAGAKEGITSLAISFQVRRNAAELRMHYASFGTPVRDANGRVTNAVLLCTVPAEPGTIPAPQFSGVLWPGQLLDITRYYIILPDNIGHGNPASRAMGCARIFRNMSTTIW